MRFQHCHCFCSSVGFSMEIFRTLFFDQFKCMTKLETFGVSPGLEPVLANTIAACIRNCSVSTGAQWRMRVTRAYYRMLRVGTKPKKLFQTHRICLLWQP